MLEIAFSPEVHAESKTITPIKTTKQNNTFLKAPPSNIQNDTK
jgi:hypothetical protein